MNDGVPARSASWKGAVGIALAALVLFAVALGARDLWNPNEPIYGEAVREMHAAGDWSVPRVNGEVFPEKPILYFWLAAAASSVFGGVDEMTLRLPSVAAALVACVALYLLVLPYAGRGRARLAVVVLATTYGFWWGARTVQMDILLTATTLCSVLLAVRGMDHGLRGRVAAAGVGLCCGLGFLAKGPIGVICPALVLLVYTLPDGARFRRLLAWVPLASAAALAVAAPWFVWLALRGEPGLLEEMLWRQNVVRFLEPWDHAHPWWYYGVHFWVDGLPWSLLLPWALVLPGRKPAEARLDRLALGWILALLVFFSLSSSKRSAYLLPAAPAVAILVAGLFHSWHRRTLDLRRAWGLRGTQTVLAAAIALGGGYLFIAAETRLPLIQGPARLLALWMAAGGCFWVAAVWWRRRTTGFIAALVLFCGIYLAAAVAVLPAANAYKSARGFGEQLRREVPADASLQAYKVWRWRSGYIYYGERTMPRITDSEALVEYWRRDETVYLLIERGMWEEAQEILGPLSPRISADIGHNRVYVVANR